MVPHTAGDTYSNLDLWLHGQAERQAAASPDALIWTAGTDATFWVSSGALVAAIAATVGAYVGLARAARRHDPARFVART